MSDETIFFGYAKAIATGNSASTECSNSDWVSRTAIRMVEEHRKLFPKKLDKK